MRRLIVASAACLALTSGAVRAGIPPIPAPAPGAAIVFKSLPSGFWYMPYFGVLNTSTGIVANRIACTPFYLPMAMTLASISGRITTAASGGNIELGIYANAGNQPSGAVIASTTSISTASVGQPATPSLQQGSSVALPAGVYWGCINADSTAGGTVALTNLSYSTAFNGAVVGASSQSDLNDTTADSRFYLYAAQTFGTWPSAGALSWNEGVSQSTAVLMLKAY